MNRHPAAYPALICAVLAVSLIISAPLWAIQIIKAQSVRVDKGKDQYGPVIVMVGGHEDKIADESSGAWLINGNKAVVYTGRDGAGGYENEGQSLYRFDLSTGRRTKLLAEVYHINKVVEVLSRKDHSLLLVSMTDGGLGAPHAAIARSSGGMVWRSPFARFVRVTNGRVVVQQLKRGEAPGSDWSKARVVRRLVLDLDKLYEAKTIQAPGNRPVGT